MRMHAVVTWPALTAVPRDYSIVTSRSPDVVTP